MPEITGYHAHVYFDADTQDTAQQVCEEAARLFPVQMGRMHARNVGPHPRWSCQLGFAADAFDQVTAMADAEPAGPDRVHPSRKPVSIWKITAIGQSGWVRCWI